MTADVTGLAADVTGLLRDMRHEAGLTQAQLALRLGWAANPHGSTKVSDYETKSHIPGPELIGRWAVACGFYAELVVTRPGSGRWVIELNDKATP